MLTLQHNLNKPLVWGGANLTLSPSHINQAYPGESIKSNVNAPYNHIFFQREVRDRDRSVIDQLDELDRRIQESGSSDPIWLHIYSYGGDLFTGFQIANHIEMVQTPVYTVIEGIAASAASIIASAGDKRFALPNSQFMIHQLSSIFWGNASEFEDEYLLQQNLMNQLTGYYSARINKNAVSPLSSDQISQMLKRNTYIPADQALEQGFIDGVIMNGEIITDPSKVRSILVESAPIEQIQVETEVNTERIAASKPLDKNTTKSSVYSNLEEQVAGKRANEEAVQEVPEDEVEIVEEELEEQQEEETVVEAKSAKKRENTLIKQVQDIAAGLNNTAKNEDQQKEAEDTASKILAAIARLEKKVDELSTRVNDVSGRIENVENDMSDVKEAFPVLAESVMNFIVNEVKVSTQERGFSSTEKQVVADVAKRVNAKRNVQPPAPQGATPGQQMIHLGIPVGSN